MPLSAGTTVDNIVRLLSFIVSRHESLRTRIRVEPDGTPMQVLSESGEVALEILDLEENEDPAETGEAVRQRCLDAPFDFEKDWPVRMTVIRRHGEPVHFVAMYPHIVIDGYGFEALIRDLANLDQSTGAHLGPRAGTQPMELARQQQTPAIRRQGQASLRYWEELLLKVPPRRFNDSTDRREPRYLDATYNSPAAYLALRTLVARTQLHSGPILLAAYATALARVTGINPSVIQTRVSNRFRPGLAESVSTLVQPGLCVIDVADCTFDEAATRAWRSQLNAGKYGYYDPRDLRVLVERINEQRGTEVDLMCSYNDGRRALAQLPPGPLPTEEELEDALQLSALTSGSPVRIPEQKAFLAVHAVPETINYSLRVDTHHLSPAEQEAILRMIEEILVTAALDPVAPTKVPTA